MLYSLAAAAVLLFHLAFILFALLGAILTARWRWMPLCHLPIAAWAVFIEMSGGRCPLTDLENFLRRQAGQSGYSESFIEHYLVAIIYPAGLTRDLQFLFAGIVIAINLVVYARLMLRKPNQH